MRLAKPNGRIVKWSRNSGRSTDTRLLRQYLSPLRLLNMYVYVGWKDTRMAAYHLVTYM